ncbi:ribonuclease H-like domain-containing protein [Candidatus Kaiserbacteria bacterium]|nr:ribonuclease H-like domain-containing protein [Candidatus Kaiserbacteria bacterium]MCB9812009.1 ribonuclease H-like domain-containing protein [Candidatus Nomurabacteria bacterium]
MATLIFDIETIGEDWDALDETTQHVLTRWVERTAGSDEEREAALRDIREGLGFSPLTGQVVAIGLYDLERQQGVVYYSTNTDTDAVSTIYRTKEEKVGEYTLKERTEEEMLSEFWDGAQHYDTFVTFNGRAFDVPFLVHRAVILGIKPTVDMMSGRYLYQQKTVKHIDLQDQLTFYGAMHRRPNLHLFCRAYGIESPKAEGVAGDDVAQLYKDGQFLDIARYNVRDVVATTELYKKWLQYFKI